MQKYQGILTWQLSDFDGNILDSGKKAITIQADSSWKVLNFENHFVNDSAQTVLVATLTIQNGEYARNAHYFSTKSFVPLKEEHIKTLADIQ